MGPGPSDVPPSVLKAMGQSLVGHLDPSFVGMMEEIKAMLRQVFLTENEMTFPISGTGSAGMEFCFANLIEPGDEVVIGVNGVFGTRMADVASRCGAEIVKVDAEWGSIIEPTQIAQALNGRSPKLVAIVHAETSTGAPGGRTDVIRHARARGVTAGHDTRTRGAADGAGGVGAGELHARSREPIAIGRVVKRAAKGFQVAPSEIIDEKKYEVERLGFLISLNHSRAQERQ